MHAHTREPVQIRVFQTAAHPCGYWPGREARDLVLDPQHPALPSLYPGALQMGFRRSGDRVYRPRCEGCRACVAVRVAVAAFRPDRSQRRCAMRNADLRVDEAPARCDDEVFALYRRYLAARHPGGGMDDPAPEDFEAFLVGRWSSTRFLQVRDAHDRLLAVAVTDRTPDALSAVYTFYDPDAARRGLGTFAILGQIDWARRSGRPHLYLGYWIDGHPKMDYKRRFAALERLDGAVWRPFHVTPPPSDPGDHGSAPRADEPAGH